MTQSSKNILMVTGFFLVLLLAYRYSFSKTLEVKNELKDLKTQVEQSSGAPQNMDLLEEKEKHLDSLISGNRIGYTSPQNRLLQVLNDYSQKITFKIIRFKEPHVAISQGDENKITSFQFVLEGEYKALEKLLFLLETEHNFGSFSHVSFETKKDYRLNRNFLQCSVVVQYIE